MLEIKCNSPYAIGTRCVACMDGLESLGGTIDCSTAEDFDYDEKLILDLCEYAEGVEYR